MEMAPDHIILGTLLSACKIHINIEFCLVVACAYFIWVMKRGCTSESKNEGGWNAERTVSSSVEVTNEIHDFLLGDLR